MILLTKEEMRLFSGTVVQWLPDVQCLVANNSKGGDCYSQFELSLLALVVTDNIILDTVISVVNTVIIVGIIFSG